MFTEHIAKHIKRFKQSIEGTSVTATTIRQSGRNGYFLRFSDGSVISISIREPHRIIVFSEMYGGPKHSIPAGLEIDEPDPYHAGVILEQHIGRWLASSDQDNFPAKQCINRYYLLEEIESRIKQLGIKTSDKLNAFVLDVMVQADLIKRDGANCLVMPAIAKHEFMIIVDTSIEGIGSEQDDGIGEIFIVEVAGRKYPCKVLGTEVISEKTLPKSRVYDVLREVQRNIDRNGNIVCSKCGSSDGFMMYMPMSGKRAFTCGSCRIETPLSDALHFVSKFSERAIENYKNKPVVKLKTIDEIPVERIKTEKVKPAKIKSSESVSFRYLACSVM